MVPVAVEWEGVERAASAAGVERTEEAVKVAK